VPENLKINLLRAPTLSLLPDSGGAVLTVTLECARVLARVRIVLVPGMQPMYMQEWGRRVFRM
jgi:hypothetical protein